MKYRTEIVREGENLGPIDFNYNFIQHFDTHCCSDEKKREYCDAAVARLRQLAESADPTQWQIRCGEYWYDVVDIGMYDGWPFWKPDPAVMRLDRVFHTGVWEFFYSLDDVRKASTVKERGT